jgi:acetyl-CoA carboxylase biotin carboxyl carrier protein
MEASEMSDETAGASPAPGPPGAGEPVIDRLSRRAEELAAATPRPLRRLRLESGESAVELEWPGDGGAAAPSPGDAPPPPPAKAGDQGPEAGEAGDGAGTWHVSAPLVGTFYTAPGPGAPPFVQPGDAVEAGQQVGIIEAMKLMNGIEAERAGRVVEILVPNATAVEYEQPLIALADPPS